MLSSIRGVVVDADYNGDAQPATSVWLNEPIGITIDPYGVLYFTDSYEDRVRMLKNNQL